MSAVRRYVPDMPFPPYRFVPGQAPHPHSNPAGHSYGVTRQPPAPLDPERWPESAAYLYGVDLFNHGFYWEAHEAWEGLWLAAGRRGGIADFLKALIQLAAAGVKQCEGVPEGVRTHANRAAELFRATANTIPGDLYLGLPFRALATAIHRDGWTPPALILTFPPE